MNNSKNTTNTVQSIRRVLILNTIFIEKITFIEKLQALFSLRSSHMPDLMATNDKTSVMIAVPACLTCRLPTAEAAAAMRLSTLLLYSSFHTYHAMVILTAARQQCEPSMVKFSSSALLQPEVSEHWSLFFYKRYYCLLYTLTLFFYTGRRAN